MSATTKAAGSRTESLSGDPAPQAHRLNRRGPHPEMSARDYADYGEAEGGVAPDQQKRLVRRRKKTENKFHINKSLIPRGWSYEWKRDKYVGVTDVDHQVNLRENAWSPVPAERHPEMMPIGHNGPIEKDGMILMERPDYLTQEAMDEDYEWAMGQVRTREAQISNTPSGTLTRDHPSVRRISGVKHSYGPVDAES